MIRNDLPELRRRYEKITDPGLEASPLSGDCVDLYDLAGDLLQAVEAAADQAATLAAAYRVEVGR